MNAVDHFEWAVAYQPDYVEAHNNLGSTLLSIGKLDDAVKSYEKALTLKPDYAEAQNNLGIAFHKLGQLDDCR